MSEVNEAGAKPNTSLLIRGAIWIAIGALIAAALVCVVWVLIGDQDGLIGRAFLTILLLAGFAGHRDPRGRARASPTGLAGAGEHDHLDHRADRRCHQDLASRRAGGVHRRGRALLHAAADRGRTATGPAARAPVHSCGTAVRDDVHPRHLLRHDRDARAAGRDARHLPDAPRHLHLRRPVLADRRRARDPHGGGNNSHPAAECACSLRRNGTNLPQHRMLSQRSEARGRSAAVAGVRRRRHPAADPARRIARLERLLHGVSDRTAGAGVSAGAC